MLEDSLSFPQTSDDWLGTVVIGAVLSLLGFLILPGIVVQGYLVRVVRAAATGDPAPSFTDWGELLVDGLRLFVLNLAVALLVAVPFVVVFGIGGAFGGLTGSRAAAGIIVTLGLLVAGLLALVALYFLPAAVANFAIEDSLSAAFDVRAVVDGALSSDYALAWLLAIVIGLIGGLVGSALSVILVGFLVIFYVQVVTYYLFGRGFAAGLGVGAWGMETVEGTGSWTTDGFGGSGGGAGGLTADEGEEEEGTGSAEADEGEEEEGTGSAETDDAAGSDDSRDDRRPGDGTRATSDESSGAEADDGRAEADEDSGAEVDENRDTEADENSGAEASADRTDDDRADR